jgi:hopene-associated glycosyltransferase HpnB
MLVLIATVCLSIWLILTFGRAGFWHFKDVKRASTVSNQAAWPAVVAIVPARNEAAHIGGCVRALLSQQYPGSFKVVVVDDSSADATAVRAIRAAADLGAEDRISVVTARVLPSGWTGKVWAQSEGVEFLNSLPGDDNASYLWFTDADIVHRPGVLKGLVAEALEGKLVLNSHMVHLRCTSFAERALIPAFVFFFAMLYPFPAVNNPRRGCAAAAGG